VEKFQENTWKNEKETFNGTPNPHVWVVAKGMA
jgi:hypothetical protein